MKEVAKERADLSSKLEKVVEANERSKKSLHRLETELQNLIKEKEVCFYF
jgi:phage shock protein A